eukprot:TRINITY_DN25801_c0_g1_i1.p1 TRINITY_DN25801_c0_g1~~TRINITY_DN25801_c0_g1_i1.p1  ORF type:complete len:544 (-),score=108.07 TRINITY_DN25801_c0_g1_i1:185-1723(-)
MDVGGEGALQAAREPLFSPNAASAPAATMKGEADLEKGARRGAATQDSDDVTPASSPPIAPLPERLGTGRLQSGGSSGSTFGAPSSMPAWRNQRSDAGVGSLGLRPGVGGRMDGNVRLQAGHVNMLRGALDIATAPGGRRMQGGLGSACRMSSPIRTTAEARRKLQESLNADGEAKAVCIGAALDLDRLAASINVSPAVPKAGAAASGALPSSPERTQPVTLTPATASRASSLPRVPLGLDTETEVIRKFGVGENLVLQLKLFNDKDLFAFRYGCVVCWNFTTSEYAVTKDRLKPFTHRPHDNADCEEESMEFVIKRKAEHHDSDQDSKSDDGKSENGSEDGGRVIKHDQIVLSTTDPLERLAHSYALAQSVRLAVFEIVVDRSIAKTRSIPEIMATTGEVNLDARELSRQMGGLLMLRCDVNLHTDILDTPDIFWDEERFEPHYVESREYLEVDKRVEILNQRLSVLKDLYDLLQNGLNVRHGNKLEWIIIILILIEVVLELLELLHDAWA